MSEGNSFPLPLGLGVERGTHHSPYQYIQKNFKKNYSKNQTPNPGGTSHSKLYQKNKKNFKNFKSINHSSSIFHIFTHSHFS